jgi:hypothetical protein
MIDRQADQARQDKLDELYAVDGRHDPNHPMHSLYTGLWAAYVNTAREVQS